MCDSKYTVCVKYVSVKELWEDGKKEQGDIVIDRTDEDPVGSVSNSPGSRQHLFINPDRFPCDTQFE